VTSYASPALAAPDGGGPPARRAGPHRACVVGDDEHFIGFEPMICRDDEEAVAKAQRLVNGHDMELWSGERLVIRLECSPKLLK